VKRKEKKKVTKKKRVSSLERDVQMWQERFWFLLAVVLTAIGCKLAGALGAWIASLMM
jgi:hypothetical protein